MRKHNHRISHEENSKRLARMWSRFINWDGRRIGENGFLERTLAANDCGKILDSGMGDGCDLFHLSAAGFYLVGNETNENFARVALKFASAFGITVERTAHDWTDMTFRDGEFDAVLCMGNSITYVFDARKRLAILREFARISGKVLLIDERNYQRILDRRKQILGTGNFPYSYNYVYCGREVIGYPVEITDDKVVFEYRDMKTGETAHLELYPFKRGELEMELRQVFPRVIRFSDYREGFDPNADFYQYVAMK